MTVGELLGLLERVRKAGHGWMARCPAHEDRDPSLSIAEGDDGAILIHDFGGCPAEKVLASLGLEWRDLRPGDYDGTLPHRQPRTPEERMALANSKLRRQVNALRLENRRLDAALARACLILEPHLQLTAEEIAGRLIAGAIEPLQAEAVREANAALATIADNHLDGGSEGR